MSSSQIITYKVILTKDHMLGALHGFRRTDKEGQRYQVRILNTDKEIDDYEAEMWLYGMQIKLERIFDL